MIVTDHLNKIESGRQVALGFLGAESQERNPSGFIAKKTAIVFICMGLGLIKIAETAIKE